MMALAMIMQPAVGQEGDVNDEKLEEVVVIGSRMTRQDFSSPSPIVTMEAIDFRLAGATSSEDLLNSLPQFIPDADRTRNGGGGLASINLRGLGSNRTLVMLNGRRFAASQVAGAADINSIPATLIKRVEVVTGGASAVYGSDAVVGVVNFILDDDFEGIALNAHYELTHEGDGQVLDLTVSAGTSFANGRGHVSGFFNFNERDPLFGDDREFTSKVIIDDTNTGELVEFGSSAVPEGAILFPSAIIDGMSVYEVVFDKDGTLRPANFPEELYNYAPDNYLQVPLERSVFAAFASFDFTPELRGTLELLHSQTELWQQFAPTPIGFYDVVTIDSPFLPELTQQIMRDSYDPDGDGLAQIFMRRRMSEVEPRRFSNERDVTRLLAGIEGKIFDNWEWEAYYSHTYTDDDPLTLNALSRSRFMQTLVIDSATGGCLDPSGGCVPANIYGEGNVSREAADFMRFAAIESDEKVTEQVASAVVTGALWDLPAGPINAAAGLEWRRLEGILTPDPVFPNDDVIGASGFRPAKGATEVAEVFGEVRLPLLSNRRFAEHLAIEAGARSSEYNTAGRVSTWKLGGEWLPIEGLRFRVMYQEAIRAPNVLEMFEVPTQTFLNRFGPETDLCSASRDPVGNGLADVCIAQGLDPDLVGIFEAPDPNFVQFSIGGNPDLKSEESTSITAGFVLEPTSMEGLHLSIDYFDIEIEEAILDIQAGALASCFVLKDPKSKLCTGYTRDATGRIAEANNYPRNVARQRSEGVDFHLVYSLDTARLALFDDFASIDLSLIGTWYLTNGGQTSPITPFHDCAGYFGFTCAFSNSGVLPELKTRTNLNYTSGPLQASLTWRWIDRMKNSEPLFRELFGLPEPVLAIPETASKSYIDLSGTYDVTDNIQLYGGVINLFNTDPQMLAGAAPGLNTDSSTFDTIGRRYFLGVNYRMQ